MKNRICALLSATLLGCSQAPAGVTAIAFAKNYYELNAGDSISLTAILSGSGKVVYLSSNEDIVSIDGAGNAKALSAGDATIFAVSDGLSARTNVHVIGKSESPLVQRYVVEGTMRASMPAFAASLEEPFAVTFAYEKGDSPRFYLEQAIPVTTFGQALLALADSPFMQQNLSHPLPQGYQDLRAIIQNATGPLLAKSIVHEGVIDAYFYEEGVFVGTASFDVSSSVSSTKDILELIKTISLEDLSAQDLLSVLAATLDKGPIDSGDPEVALMQSLLSHANFHLEKAEDKMSLSFGVESGFGDSLFHYFSDYSFGDSPVLGALGMSASIQREGDEYHLTKASFAASATLFGEANELEIACIPTTRSKEASDYIQKIESSLREDAEK